MSKTKSYLYILAALVIIMVVGYVLNISLIKSACSTVLANAGNPWISVSAAVCAFIFYGNKNYWLVMAACALTVSLPYQFILVSHHAVLLTILLRALTFLIIVYLMNLLKLLINKG